MSGAGISPANDAVVVYKGAGNDSKLQVVLREGMSFAGGTYLGTTQATIDANGNIAILAQLKDSENDLIKRDAVLFGQPHAIRILEWNGRSVESDGFQQLLRLAPRLRHTSLGAVAYKIQIGTFEIEIEDQKSSYPYHAIIRGTSRTPILESGKRYSGLPDGALLFSIDDDFLMNASGQIALTGSYCIPPEKLVDQPVCFRGCFLWDGNSISVLDSEETTNLVFSLSGQSLGENGHLTFRGKDGGIMLYTPFEGLAAVELPGVFIARTGVGPGGNVLAWALDGNLNPANTPDSLWQWNRFGPPALIAREGETELPFRNGLTLVFDRFDDAAIGPNDRIAFSGRASRGFHYDVVWMTDDEGNLRYVERDAGLPPFETDVNNFINALGNGADGRRSAFFNDGSLLIRVNRSVRRATDIPKPPDVRISMHRISDRRGYQDISIKLGTSLRDADLDPVEDPAILGSQPTINGGLVADGVTPLLFRFEAAEGFVERPARYRIEVKVDSGGTLAIQGSSRLRTLTNGSWGRTGYLDFTPDDSVGYAYIAAIDGENVRLDKATELEATVAIFYEQNSEPVDSLAFRIRKPPPLLLVPDLPSAGWGKDFLNALYETYPRDFVRQLQSWRVATKGVDDEGKHKLFISPLGEFENNPTIRNLQASWALTRPDVVGHGRGAIIAGSAVVDVNDLRRGVFRRAIAIGTSQRFPPRIAWYHRRLTEKVDAFKSPTARSLLSFVPESLEPLSDREEIYIYLHRPGNLAYQLSRTPFHLVGTQLNLTGENFPDFFLFSGLVRTGVGLQIVAPAGSDGLVGVDETLTDWQANEMTLVSDPLAHREPASSFGGALPQTHSASVAKEIVALLGGNSARFRPLKGIIQDYFRNTTRAELFRAVDGIAEIALRDLFAAALRGLLAQLNLETPEGRVPRDGETVFTYMLEAPTEFPQGEARPVFLAEVYGEGGVTRKGVSVAADSANPNRVELTVEPDVTGDVVLFASYLTTNEGLMLAEPAKAVTIEPTSPLTAVEIGLPESGVLVGDLIVPEFHTIHADGTRIRRWISPDDVITAESSDSMVVDTSDVRRWHAGDPGSATVSVEFRGLTTTVLVRVGREQPGAVVARYVIHYDDKSRAEVPVVYGIDTVDHWIANNPDEVNQGVKHIVWEQGFDTGMKNYPRSVLGVMRQAWQHPHPDKIISHIDFISEEANAAPVLLAITLE